MKILLAMITALTLTACNEKTQPEKPHDVQYYMDNDDIRYKKLDECRNNPGELEETPDCINAETASMRM